VTTVCQKSRALGFMSVKKTMALDAFREQCW